MCIHKYTDMSNLLSLMKKNNMRSQTHKRAPPIKKLQQTNHHHINTVDPCMSTRQKKTKKREMTSAIPGMSITKVRNTLSAIRSIDNESSEYNPMYLSNELENGTTIGDFCFRVFQGQHEKRHSKKNKIK